MQTQAPAMYISLTNYYNNNFEPMKLAFKNMDRHAAGFLFSYCTCVFIQAVGEEGEKRITKRK